jgi:flagellar basal-body rod modification protein FlgD
MATSAISPVGAFANPTAQGATAANDSGGGLGGLTATDFLNLFITQLRNQDPLNPTSSDSFLTQTAQLSQVQGIAQLDQDVAKMLTLQQLTQGADLIGKKVTYLAASGNGPQTGAVSGVSLANGQAQLTVGSATVPLSQVQSIRAA